MTPRQLLARGLEAALRRLSPGEEGPAPAREARGPDLPASARGEAGGMPAPLSPAAGRGEGPAAPASARAPGGGSLSQAAGVETGGWGGGGGYAPLRPQEDLERALSRRLRVLRRMGSTAGHFGEEVL